MGNLRDSVGGGGVGGGGGKLSQQQNQQRRQHNNHKHPHSSVSKDAAAGVVVASGGVGGAVAEKVPSSRKYVDVVNVDDGTASGSALLAFSNTSNGQKRNLNSTDDCSTKAGTRYESDNQTTLKTLLNMLACMEGEGRCKGGQ